MIEEQVQLVFEYPIKEQVRSFLRLEALFIQFDRNRLAVHADNHLHALKLFFEILEILERGDTRSELIKELARLSDCFTLLKQNPGVDLSKLDNFLKQIKMLYHWVLSYEGKFGERLRKDNFIDSVKHRTSIPGGTCSFDSPDLFLFLNQPSNQRQKAFTAWLEDIKGVKTSIDVILRIMRESGQWKKEVAPLGSFIVETTEQPLQLLRVRISKKSQLFPEFSCGKHRSNIHFMQFDSLNKKIAQQKEVEFELACCS
jgi:cell division protein ZapD